MRVGLWTVALGIAFGAAAAAAQTAPTRDQSDPYTLKAESRAVIVDVTVLGTNGEPVTGLQKSDFVVTEDGIPQPLSAFDEHPARIAPGHAAVLPPNTFSNAGSRQPDQACSVLLLDTLNTQKQEIGLVREHVLASLRRMPRGTRMAVFVLGDKLRMLHGFTDDPGLLVATIEDKKGGALTSTSAATHATQDDAIDKDAAEFLQSMHDAPPGSVEALNEAQTIHQAYQGDQRLGLTIEALQRLALYLEKVPGRKNLIWFSGSFPIALSAKPTDKVAGREPAQEVQIRNTTDLLALARVAIYPVPTRGVAARAAGDSSDHFHASADDMRREDGADAANTAAMDVVASASGGRVIGASNDLGGALQRAVVDGAQYYTLVYTPTNKAADGRFRAIRVTNASGSYQLAYRRGYYATDALAGPLRAAEKAAADPLTPLMGHGAAAATQLLYEIQVQPMDLQPDRADGSIGGNPHPADPLTRYRADFTIHRSAPDLQESSGSTRPGRMQVELIAYDAKGKPLNWRAGVAELSVDGSVKRSAMTTHMDLDVPAETVWLASGIYDLRSGEAGTMEIPLEAIHAVRSTAAAAAADSAAVETPASGGIAVASSSSSGSRAPILVHRTPGDIEQERSARRLIHLDVTVTDAGGHAISDLTRADVSVLDNAQAQATASLRYVDGRTEAPSEIILLLDVMNASFQEVSAERQAMLRFLRQNDGHLPLPTTVMFLSDAGAKLSGTSRDGRMLAEGVQKLPTPIRAGEAQGFDVLLQRFGRSIDSLSQLTRVEHTRPGRKLLIWLGPGWPMLSDTHFKPDARNKSSYFRSIVELSTSLRDARMTVYSVRLPDPWRTQVRAYMYRDYLKGIASPKQAEAGDLALQVLAVQSGGLVLGPDGDPVAHMNECVTDASGYYELAIEAPAEKTIDAFHEVAVRIDRPGLTVRTRNGYYTQP
jgi:VWFA-related protein